MRLKFCVGKTERDLANALLVLDVAIGTISKNSEDMERIRTSSIWFFSSETKTLSISLDGYDALMGILRRKVHLFNLEVFHTLVMHLGIDFADPE